MNSYLFMCHGAKIRSPTAESVAKEIARKKGIKIETQIGAMQIIHQLGYPTNFAEELNRYSKVIVMEQNMADNLINRCGVQKEKVYCINVYEDGRNKNHPDLRDEMRMKLEGLIV
jgi:protein-tyrosine-phosphatase